MWWIDQPCDSGTVKLLGTTLRQVDSMPCWEGSWSWGATFIFKFLAGSAQKLKFHWWSDLRDKTLTAWRWSPTSPHFQQYITQFKAGLTRRHPLLRCSRLITLWKDAFRRRNCLSSGSSRSKNQTLEISQVWRSNEVATSLIERVLTPRHPQRRMASKSGDMYSHCLFRGITFAHWYDPHEELLLWLS